MAWGAFGLAVVLVALYVIALWALGFVWAWWDGKRARKVLQRYTRVRDEAERKWCDPPRSAGRY